MHIAETLGTELERVDAIIKQACWLLDQEQYGEWIKLFAENGEYQLIARSSEIGVEMTWLDETSNDLGALLADLPKYIHDRGRRTHLLTNLRIDLDGDRATALSNFAVFRTTDAGETGCYAVGHYDDVLRRQDGHWRILRRRTMLETRMFDKAPHIVPL